MSQYYGCIETSKGVKLKDVDAFKRDLALLEEMLPRVMSGWDLDYHEKEPYLFLNGDENASLEVEVDEWGEWSERLPPEERTDEQKRAHADTFGYLHYYEKFCSPEDSSEVRLLAFLQHHMVEGEIAVINGVSHEGYSIWYWTVAFTHDKDVWTDLERVCHELEEELKRSK